MNVDRALKAISVVGATSVVVLSVILASGATGAPSAVRGTGTPGGSATAETAFAAAATGPPVLPLPGKRGFPAEVGQPSSRPRKRSCPISFPDSRGFPPRRTSSAIHR